VSFEMTAEDHFLGHPITPVYRHLKRFSLEEHKEPLNGMKARRIPKKLVDELS
jgi:hypothetical protein